MRPLSNIKLILLISLCVVINVIMTKDDKLIPGQFSTWVEKIPLENPKWASHLKDFDGCRSKCGQFCTGKHKGVSFCASILLRKDDPGKDPVKLILVSNRSSSSYIHLYFSFFVEATLSILQMSKVNNIQKRAGKILWTS